MSDHVMKAGTQPAICYVTDRMYALPTLISAISVRKHIAASQADMFIICFDMPVAEFDRLRARAERHAITVLILDTDASSQIAHLAFEHHYISKGTLGRFFIADTLPRDYDTIIYIDGDTWVRDGVQGILAITPAVGHLAVVEDPFISFAKNDRGAHGRMVRAYYHGLGLPPEARYFNAGVLIGSSATWRRLGRDAFDFYRDNAGACTYFDQSALNAVARDRCVFISPRWNFTSLMFHFGAEKAVCPVVYHFTGSPKPWMGVFAPWSAIARTYRSALTDVADVELPRRIMTRAEERAATRASLHIDFVMHTTELPKLLSRRRAVARQLDEATI